MRSDVAAASCQAGRDRQRARPGVRRARGRHRGRARGTAGAPARAAARPARHSEINACRRARRRIDGAAYFQWLLTKFTTPEEVFGAVSLRALENDEYRRVTTRKLPEAHVAFLDEIFKASSSILNALLTLLNERRFDNGRDSVEVPLLTVFGAANELPEEDELSAIYDRFLVRFVVGYVVEDCALPAHAARTPPVAGTRISVDELALLWEAVGEIVVPDGILRHIGDLRRALGEQQIVPSDRRFRQSVTRCCARSRCCAVATRSTTTRCCSSSTCCGATPAEQATVKDVLRRLLHGFDEQVQELLTRPRARRVHRADLGLAREQRGARAHRGRDQAASHPRSARHDRRAARDAGRRGRARRSRTTRDRGAAAGDRRGRLMAAADAGARRAAAVNVVASDAYDRAAIVRLRGTSHAWRGALDADGAKLVPTSRHWWKTSSRRALQAQRRAARRGGRRGEHRIQPPRAARRPARTGVRAAPPRHAARRGARRARCGADRRGGAARAARGSRADQRRPARPVEPRARGEAADDAADEAEAGRARGRGTRGSACPRVGSSPSSRSRLPRRTSTTRTRTSRRTTPATRATAKTPDGEPDPGAQRTRRIGRADARAMRAAADKARSPRAASPPSASRSGVASRHRSPASRRSSTRSCSAPPWPRPARSPTSTSRCRRVVVSARAAHAIRARASISAGGSPTTTRCASCSACSAGSATRRCRRAGVCSIAPMRSCTRYAPAAASRTSAG